MIQLQQASLQRGIKALFQDASMTLHSGHRVGLIGPNGCGKSSLFKLLTGQLTLEKGELSLASGWRIAHMSQETQASERTALDFVLDGHKELRQLEQQLAVAEADGNDQRQAELHGEMDRINGYQARYQAEMLLHGLGFNQTDINRPVTDFSGGWRIRLNLAQALIMPSELLLLDEPTNHLDLDATLWLERWLKQYTGTLLLISHDRDFLDAICEHIVAFEGLSLATYRGNYSSYERQRGERLAQQQAAYDKQQQRIQEIQQFVNRFRAKATKARQAQSRLKELERMETIAPAHIDSPFQFRFPTPEKTANTLLSLQQVSAGYADKSILEKVNLSILAGTRLALLGPNGAGKSTLLKTLCQELSVQGGDLSTSEFLRIGYFAQHQLEALDLDSSATVHLERLDSTASEQQIRNFLGGFGFSGDQALQPVRPFSGGEKARLALAIIAWQKPNLLLLDEPTNHLDLEMRQALALALQSYEGAVVLISHDRYLLRNTVDECVLVANGKVESFDGDLGDYERWLTEYQRSHQPEATTTTSPAAKDKKAARQQAAQLRAQLRPLQKQLNALEKAMDKHQSTLERIDTELSDNSIYEESNKQQLQQLLKDQGAARQSLEDAEAEWLMLSEELEEKKYALENGDSE